MRKLLFLTILTAFFNFGLKAQENLGAIKWLTFEEAEKLDSAENRPFLIDVYTDWCGWCKRMMATTFSNPQLAGYINQNFYCVRLDAETKDTISFLGKTWVSDGHNNYLARHLLRDRLSYPTIVYMDKKKNSAPIPGYMEIKDIEPILVYFAEDLSGNVDLEEFKDMYMFNYPNIYKNDLSKLKDTKVDTLGKVNWLTFDEASKKYQKEKKPILIDVYIDRKYRGYVPYCTINSLIHEGVVMKNKKMCDYINQNFYPVRFEATTKDTIYWLADTLKQHAHVSLGNNLPNNFTHVLMNNNFKFPSMFFFDKDLKLVGKTDTFIAPDLWLTVMKFYATEAYKRQNFETFYKANHKS
ncbi:MAG: DUF255 domain-containing protein [Bacteroidales bacterium]|nr:DUF255 domain-containing protein [Bacteroidales bacterium]